MSRKKETVKVSILLIIIFSGFVLVKPNKVESTTEPFFTLTAITNSGGIRPDYLFFLKQHCARIGIHIQIFAYDWGTFVGELLNPQKNWDISFVNLIGFAGDPDWSKVYGENGSLNICGYHTSMDWDEELGTGRNEWYMQTGIELMPPESEERVQHYWAWQQYMMDKILPIQPVFNPKSMMATWSNLQGYDYAEGLLPSWGKMSFTGLHTGQKNQDELIIAGEDYQTINPIFSDSYNYDISSLILDPAIWYDSQLNVHPHLATDVSLINDTHIRISIREGVKWNSDPDGFFTNEYVDVDDFYFTYYAFKHLADEKQLFKWIKDIVKVNQYTLDIHIDRDPDTLENDNFAPFQKYLEMVSILPEHYLNQTQLPDGQTPDIADSSWSRFATDGFGTGLFEFQSHIEGVQTTLSVVNDCWYLDPLVDKSDMDFTNRFGDFTGGLNKLRIRAISHREAQLTEFEIGKIDMVPITGFLDIRDEYLQDPDFEVHSRFSAILSYFGYNMRENRDPIGSREPCADDPTITKGLAVRKAISYALDVEEINNVLFGGEYLITHYPFYETLAKWKNPNIIRYDHNLDTAREFMALANYTGDILEPDRPNGWEISGMVLISVFIAGVIVFTFFKTKKK